MERRFRLSDGRTIEDQQEIDRLFEQRRSVAEQRKTTPPPKLLKDFNLTRATLSRRERTLFGTVEVGSGIENPLYEIVDLTIDLTPEKERVDISPELQQVRVSPQSTMGFDLTDGAQKITIDVVFDYVGEYKRNFRDEAKLESIVSTNLLSLLQETNEANWQCDETGAWSAVK